MSDKQDKERSQGAAAGAESPPVTGDAPTQDKRSGRVAFDARGNPIWEWQLETGVYSRDINTQKLKKLDLGDLSIAESAIQKQPPGLAEPSASKGHGQSAAKMTSVTSGGGFDPYDNSSRPSYGADPYDSARVLANRINSEQVDKRVTERSAKAPPARRAVPAASVPKQSVLGKLNRWLKGGRKSKDDPDYE